VALKMINCDHLKNINVDNKKSFPLLWRYWRGKWFGWDPGRGILCCRPAGRRAAAAGVRTGWRTAAVAEVVVVVAAAVVESSQVQHMTTINLKNFMFLEQKV
jgi:hypothetical protein